MSTTYTDYDLDEMEDMQRVGMAIHFHTRDALVEAMALIAHRTNLQRGGVFQSEGEELEDGEELGLDGRVSNLRSERQAAEAQVKFITRYTFIAKGQDVPFSEGTARGIVSNKVWGFYR